MAVSGLGALTGSIYLASRETILGLGRFIPMFALFGIGIIVFALSQTLILSLAMMFIAGVGMIVQMAASNIILQSIVEEDKRGRVMSIYTTAFIGMVPLGNLFAVLGPPDWRPQYAHCQRDRLPDRFANLCGESAANKKRGPPDLY